VTTRRSGGVCDEMKGALAAALLAGAATAAGCGSATRAHTSVLPVRPVERKLLGAEVQIVAYPGGDVRICGIQGSDLMFDEAPPRCRNGLRAVGVRVSALTSRQQGKPQRWGSIYVAGTIRHGTFFVTSQRKWAPRSAPGAGQTFERPPCPTPAGGWRLAPPTYSQEAAIRAYEGSHRGDVTSVVYFRHSTIPVVASFHPSRARAALARAWPRQLCVVRARWTLAALSRARKHMLQLLSSDGNRPRYGWISGAGGIGESDSGQPTTPLEVLIETPALRRLVRSYPPGLVAVDPVFLPVRS